MKDSDYLEAAIEDYKNRFSSLLRSSGEIDEVVISNKTNQSASDLLFSIMTKNPQEWSYCITRKNGLKDAVLGMSRDDIKDILLKKSILIRYDQVARNTVAGKSIGFDIDISRGCDAVTCNVANNIEADNIDNMYDCLDNNEVLKNICLSFVCSSERELCSRNPNYVNDIKSRNIIDKLDLYYARYANRGRIM